jgi:ribosomal protein S9
MNKENKSEITRGNRKTAKAVIRIKEGSGKVIINKKLLDAYNNKLFKYEVLEPIILAGDEALKYDYYVTVKGGGIMARSRAIRSAIAKALVAMDGKLKQKFLAIDRTLLVDDRRITEPQKPYRSAARALKQTSYR